MDAALSELAAGLRGRLRLRTGSGQERRKPSRRRLTASEASSCIQGPIPSIRSQRTITIDVSSEHLQLSQRGQDTGIPFRVHAEVFPAGPLGDPAHTSVAAGTHERRCRFGWIADPDRPPRGAGYEDVSGARDTVE